MKPAFLKLLIVPFSILALASCALQNHRFEPDTLRVNLGAEPPSLDWSTATDSTSFDVVSNLMVGLTQYRSNLTVAPGCAKSWEILDHGKLLRFHLRDDALWSDGRPVVAYDFEYSWKRLLNPTTAAQYAYFFYDIVNAFEYNTGSVTDPEKVGVKALDDHTLEVRLKKAAAYFIYLTAFCPSYPQRRDLIEKWGSSWTDPGKLVSNGPFLLAKWQHEYKIELVANPRFVEGAPRVSKLKMFMIPEQVTAFSLYENNQLDFVDNRSFSTPDVRRCLNSPEYHNFPLLRNNYIGFNVNKAPFQDARVRQAFSMAIDRNVFPTILRRKERPSNSWLLPGLIGYSQGSGVSFNPEAAKQLLAQAGYPNGKGFPSVELLYPNREDTRLVVEAVQDQLKRNLNVSVQLLNQEWRVYLETLHRDPPPVYRGSWGADYPDPETFMNLFTTHNGNNSTGWSNSVYDALLDQASAEQDGAKRGALYERADALLCQEAAPITPTFQSTQNIMVKPWVHGIEPNAMDLQFFKTVRIGE
jgi:oligopeptide transport system substrate-binding protein